MDRILKNGNSLADDKDLETDDERRVRWRSIYIMYFNVFLMSLGFSIILTSVWPYLDKLDPTAGKEYMGLIVAANPLGQMLFSPIFGYWSNKVKTVHLPLLLTVGLFTIASGWYSFLELFSSYRKELMFATRFLTGVSSSDIAVCRSYISAATTVKERTRAVSMISFAQVLGFIIGPALQAAVTPLGDQGYALLSGYLPVNMYTATGWINVVLGTINFILFLPVIFVDKKIAAKEAMVRMNLGSERAAWKNSKPDYISAWTLIAAFFVLSFNFVLLETLATSLSMDQFAWSKEEALFYMGIVMAVGGVLACITFISIEPLCKYFQEIKVMIWGGFVLMVLARLISIPWGPSTPPMIQLSKSDYLDYLNGTLPSNISVNSTELLGCPPIQEWCFYTPVMTLTQFIIGYSLTAIGYPIGITLIQTIFSKSLGPRPQGTWMGWMTGAGCLSRVLGPVFIGVIYTRLGTIWTFSITSAMMIACTSWLLFMFERVETAVEEHTKYAKSNRESKPRESVDLVPLRRENEAVS